MGLKNRQLGDEVKSEGAANIHSEIPPAASEAPGSAEGSSGGVRGSLGPILEAIHANVGSGRAAEVRDTAEIGAHAEQTEEGADFVDTMDTSDSGAEPSLTALAAPQSSSAALMTLSPEMCAALEQKAAAFKTEHRFAIPAVSNGNPTAIEYGGTITNYSTLTSIEALPDGQKVFVIYNYFFSFVHRWLDSFVKWGSRTKMSKVSSKEWPRTFGERSNIPLLHNNDVDTVILPYIPNVNAWDLFANNHEIADWGPCPWAAEVTVEKKLEIFRKIIEAISKTHAKGVAWGETILGNIIVDNNEAVYICDPETLYNDDLPATEQKARDLRDIFICTCGALKNADSFEDFERVLQVICETYPDPKVLEFLYRELSKDLTFMEHLFYGYTAVRLGSPFKQLSKKDYRKALEVLRTHR